VESMPRTVRAILTSFEANCLRITVLGHRVVPAAADLALKGDSIPRHDAVCLRFRRQSGCLGIRSHSRTMCRVSLYSGVSAQLPNDVAAVCHIQAGCWSR